MRNNIYVKKAYTDENIMIYLHFQGENAVRQIEVSTNKIIKLSEEKSIIGDSFLYDQKFSDIVWSPDDFISENEFESMWNKDLNSND